MRGRCVICFLLALRLGAVEPGQPLPDLGEVTWLHQGQAAPGAYRLVQFWASWSPPCLQAIPVLNDLHHRYSDRLAIQALSPENKDDLAAFLRAGGAVIGYPVGSVGKDRLRAIIGPHGDIPRVLLVAPDGTVLWNGHPLLVAHPIAGLLERKLDPQTVITIHGTEQKVFSLLKRRAWDAAMTQARNILQLDPGHAFMRELLERMHTARSKRPDIYP